MPRILYGNFDFEHELECSRYRPTAKLRSLAAQLAPFLIALAEDGDCLWTEAPLSQSFLRAASCAGFERVISVPSPLGEEEARRAGEEISLPTDNPAASEASDWQFTPWGHSHAAQEFATQNAWSFTAPGPAIVRRVNDRAFAARLEMELGCNLPGSRHVRSHSEFLEAIIVEAEHFQLEPHDFKWVAKSRFGMASRGRILGRGTRLDDPSAGWLWKQFDRNESVQFEPWGTADAEFSTQWIIPNFGEPELLGWTRILTNPGRSQTGWAYQTGIDFEASEFSAALPVLRSAIERIAEEGYFGPAGIDSMLCQLPGSTEPVVRPLQDINARLTMGRLMLEVARRVAPDSCAVWLHLPSDWLCRILELNSPQEADAFYSDNGLSITELLQVESEQCGFYLSEDARAVLTSPLWLGKLKTARCGVLIASPSDDYLSLQSLAAGLQDVASFHP